MVGDVSGADARGVATEIGVRRRFEITALARQAESINLAPVMLENFVQLAPRQQMCEPVRLATTLQMLRRPIGPDEGVGRDRRNQRRQP